MYVYIYICNMYVYIYIYDLHHFTIMQYNDTEGWQGLIWNSSPELSGSGRQASMSFPSWSLSTRSFQASPQMSLMQSNLRGSAVNSDISALGLWDFGSFSEIGWIIMNLLPCVFSHACCFLWIDKMFKEVKIYRWNPDETCSGTGPWASPWACVDSWPLTLDIPWLRWLAQF